MLGAPHLADVALRLAGGAQKAVAHFRDGISGGDPSGRR